MDKRTYQQIVEQEQTHVMGDMQHHFARKEPFERIQRYIEGLMSDVRRRNGWQLAEQMPMACNGYSIQPLGS